jgi:hypothetical protein
MKVEMRRVNLFQQLSDRTHSMAFLQMKGVIALGVAKIDFFLNDPQKNLVDVGGLNGHSLHSSLVKNSLL